MTKGLIISAPASGAGKTTLALGLLRAIKRRRITVQPLKCGPDYIDPAFHRAAAGRDSFNIDSWAMNSRAISSHIGFGADADIIVAEGAMGLFDGALQAGEWGNGTSADIARLTGWPVVLLLDVSAQAQTAAAITQGIAGFSRDVAVAGVILNKVAGERHRALVQAAMAQAGIRVFGALPRQADLQLPSRHLGLVQSVEHKALDPVLNSLADFVAGHVDIDGLLETAVDFKPGGSSPEPLLAPPAQRIAVAQDEAFSFLYPHHLRCWRDRGAEIMPFSPLADEGPAEAAEVAWLPGGYPELHAGPIAAASSFKSKMRDFAKSHRVHGECGGYMVMGQALIDGDGSSHEMLGLLGLVTSFEIRKLNLGYRRASFHAPLFGNFGLTFSGHEFHYSSIVDQPDPPLAEIWDASSQVLPQSGSVRGNATGTFFHLIGEASADNEASAR